MQYTTSLFLLFAISFRFPCHEAFFQIIFLPFSFLSFLPLHLSQSPPSLPLLTTVISFPKSSILFNFHIRITILPFPHPSRPFPLNIISFSFHCRITIFPLPRPSRLFPVIIILRYMRRLQNATRQLAKMGCSP